LARFLNEAPFSGGDSINGAFTFSSSGPVAAIALRGRTNERSEFLMTTLPVVDLAAAPSYDTVTMAHFASGLGWSTHVVLLNPTNGVISGTLQFVNADGTAAFTRLYSIAKNSSQEFFYEPASVVVKTGSVVVSPAPGSIAPVPLTIFGYSANGITVTESGVPTSSGTELATYIEATGSAADEVDSGVAIANASDQVVNVYMRLATSEGAPFGQAASLQLAPHNQVAKLLPELFPTLQLPFSGVLHMSASGPISIIDLRIAYNARHEFIVSTISPLNKATQSTAPVYLPHLVDGGGFSSRVLFVNGTGSSSVGKVLLFKTDGTSSAN